MNIKTSTNVAISYKMKKSNHIPRQDIARYALLAANIFVLPALLPEETTNSFYKIGGVYFAICLLLVLGRNYNM
jgi:hypothetical protein